MQDFPGADFGRALDEAFSSSPSNKPRATKSTPRRHHSRDGSDVVEPTGALPARTRSANRRASLAAAVNIMASANHNSHSHGPGNSNSPSDIHITAAPAERRVPRRAKHEDRLKAAAALEADHGGYDLGYGDSDGGGSGAGSGSGRERDKRGGSSRRIGRHRSEDNYQHIQAMEETDRRSRFTGNGGVASFDESIGNMRSRGRRRASLVGSVPTEEAVAPAVARSRRRRASLVASEGAAATASRAEPSVRAPPAATNSRGRIRRASLVANMNSMSIGLGYGGADADSYGGSLDDSQEEDYEKQEWQEKRANKQKAMMERLRQAKEEPEPEPEPEEEEEEPEPEVERKPRPRRRASLGILGMSTTNFASVEEMEEKKGRKKEEKEKDRRKPLGRTKSSDGGPVPSAAAAGRARATDRDRRRPGTMLDRIGT